MRVENLPPKGVVEPSSIHKVQSLLTFFGDPNRAATRITRTSNSPSIMVTAVLNQGARDLMPEIKVPHLKVVFSPLKEGPSPYIEIDGGNEIMYIFNPVDACKAYDTVSDRDFHKNNPVVISTQILGALDPRNMPDSQSVKDFLFNLHKPFDDDRKKETSPVETAPIADKLLPTDIENKPHIPPDIVVILHDEGIENFVNLRRLLEKS